jgi:hypothetical protein
MQYEVVPLFERAGGWSIPDAVLVAIWRDIVAENKVEPLFYAGGIDSPADFLRFIKSPALIVCVVVDRIRRHPVALGWLTNASGGSAFVHYCVLGPPRRAIGKALLNYWCQFRGPDGKPLFHVLLGITPETHTMALRVIRIMGFTSIGTIPDYCECAFEGGRRGAVISYYQCPAH